MGPQRQRCVGLGIRTALALKSGTRRPQIIKIYYCVRRHPPIKFWPARRARPWAPQRATDAEGPTPLVRSTVLKHPPSIQAPSLIWVARGNHMFERAPRNRQKQTHARNRPPACPCARPPSVRLPWAAGAVCVRQAACPSARPPVRPSVRPSACLCVHARVYSRPPVPLPVPTGPLGNWSTAPLSH